MSSNKFNARATRVRYKLKRLALGKPRLSVFRSTRNMYVQMIDDNARVTLHSSSSLKIKNKIIDILSCIKIIHPKSFPSDDQELIELVDKRSLQSSDSTNSSDPIKEAISMIHEVIGYNKDSSELSYPALKEVFSLEGVMNIPVKPKKSEHESIISVITELCIAIYNCSKSQLATLVGIDFCRSCKQDLTRKVVFDKGGYSYHGIIAKLADTIRSGGFQF